MFFGRLKIVFVVVVLFCSFAKAKGQECPFPGKYIEIDRAFHQCTNGQVRKGASCEFFIENVALLFQKYDCKRSFDTEPVPAIWLFDAASEDYIRLIYEMSSRSKPVFQGRWFDNEISLAKELFLSHELKSVLDGDLAEQYFPLIESVRNEK